MASTRGPHNLPARRLFVGREEELTALEEALRAGAQATITQASVYGLGGVGKTALALAYAHRALERGDYPGGVFWLKADGDPASALVVLAPILREHAPDPVSRIPEHVTNAAEIAELVRVSLGRTLAPLLLVLDGVSEGGWRERLPGGDEVRVLATTRDKRHALGRATPLETLPPAQARALAERIAGAPTSAAEADALVRVVATELGGLAVAVEMAARVVTEWALTWVAYERHLTAASEQVLEQPDLFRDYPRGVFAAIDLSIDRCPPGSRERRLLEATAAFAPDDLPVEWALASANIPPDDVETARARAALRGLMLMREDEQRSKLSLHRLVHRRVRARAGDALDVSRCAAAWVKAWIRSTVDPTSIAEIDANIQHIHEALAAADRAEEHLDWIDIADGLALHLRYRGLFDESTSIIRRALARAESLVPAIPLRVADLRSNLGVGLLDLWRPTEAIGLLQDALGVHEAMLGPEHLTVAVTGTNIALALQQMGRPEEALPYLERAVEIDLAHPGAPNPNRAKFINNLGAALHATGKHEEALPVLQTAITMAEWLYGSEHPEVAMCQSNLAELLRDMGRLGEAVPLYRSALSINESAYGPKHPRVAQSLSNLAVAMFASGERDIAVQHARRGAEIAEAVLGTLHPDTARALSNWAALLLESGRAAEAVPLLDRALAIVDKTVDAGHADLGVIRANLARALVVVADEKPDEEGRSMLMSAVSLATRALETVRGGENVLMQVAVALQARGCTQEAAQCLEQAIAALEVRLGPEDLTVAAALFHLAGVASDLEDRATAVRCLERSTAILEKNHGPDHFEVATARASLGHALRESSEPTAAISHFRVALATLERIGRAKDLVVASISAEMAIALGDTRRFDESMEAIQRAQEIVELAYGPSHPEVAACLCVRADILRAQRKSSEAIPLAERALAVMTSIHGPKRPSVIPAIDCVVRLLLDVGRLSDAIPILESKLEILEADPRQLGAIAETLTMTAFSLRRLGRHLESLPLLERALGIDEMLFAHEDPRLAASEMNLALALHSVGRTEEAHQRILRARVMAEKMLPIGHDLRRLIAANFDLIHSSNGGSQAVARKPRKKDDAAKRRRRRSR